MKRFIHFLGRSARRICKCTVITVYCLMAGYTSLLTGCVGMMPTRVPPMTKQLGYDVFNIKGWTTVGLNEFAYNWEAEKLNFWKISMDFVNKPMIAIHGQTVRWLNVGLSAGFFGGTPALVGLALKKLPKGAVKKEDHEAEVEKARREQPPED